MIQNSDAKWTYQARSATWLRRCKFLVKPDWVMGDLLAGEPLFRET
jgi:hypothetical protein